MRRSGIELLAVEGDDAGRFLAAMLQGVQPERRQGRRVGMPQNAEHAAFFMQRIAIHVIVDLIGSEMWSSLSAFEITWLERVSHIVSGSPATPACHPCRAEVDFTHFWFRDGEQSRESSLYFKNDAT